MKKELFGVGAGILMSIMLAGTALASSSDYEYIDEVEFYADIDYESSTEFEVEFETDTEGVDELTYKETSSTSSKTKKYTLTFSVDSDDDYRFADEEDITVEGENVYSITSVSVSSSGKKLTVKVSVKYKSDDTYTWTYDGTSSSSSSSSSVTSNSLTSGSVSPTYSTSSGGSWVGSGDTWRYVYSNGTYASGWVFDGSNWYYCDASNDYLMKAGLFTDTDGNIYYLDESHNGTYGRMLVGWQVIDGQQYYFIPDSGGPMGSMARNTTLVINGVSYTFNSSGTLS